MTAAVTDVIVAGAGPAGCATAIACARRGLEVILIDRARFPRDKACGEGLNPAGVSALAELGVLAAVRAHAQRLDGIGFSVGDSVAWSAFPDGGDHPVYGLGVRRVAFDATLVDAARAQPAVTFLEGVSAGAPIREEGRVVGLDCDVGPIRARAVVAADGLRSRLRSQLALDLPTPPQKARFGLRIHLRVPTLPFGPSVRVIVDPDLEYYVTPIAPDALQVAVLGSARAFARHALAAPTLLPSLREHPRLGSIVREATPIDRALGAGPLRQRVRGVVAEGALLVGDAAGYVDAITGEGMGGALRQGLAAGEVLAGAMASSRGREALPAAALEPYARAHAATVRDGDRLTELVLFLARHPWLARRAVQSMAHRPSLLTSLLRVQAGAPLSSVSLQDWASLVTG